MAVKKSGLDRWSVNTVIFGFLFLLPIFFIPSPNFSFQFTKTILAVLLLAIATIFFVLSRIKNRTPILPRHLIFYSAYAMVIVSIISAVLSNNFLYSTFGQGFELDIVVSTIAFVLLFSITALAKIKKEKVLYAFIAIGIAFGLVFIFQVLRIIIGPQFLSFEGVFNATVSNTIGSWIDLAIFSGIALWLSVSTLTFFKEGKILRISAIVTMVLSMLMLLVVNASFVWYLLLTFSVLSLVFVYFLSKPQPVFRSIAFQKNIPIYIVLIIAAVFAIGGEAVDNYVAPKLSIVNFEARPNLGTTLEISKATLSENPITGSGPNTFGRQWLLHKPAEVNTSNFWNVNFNYGVGLVPTILTTNGILGFVAWMAFFLTFLGIGLRAIILGREQDQFSKYVLVATFVTALFLWVSLFLYVPSTVNVLLTFVFTGLAVFMIRQTKTTVIKEAIHIKDKKKFYAYIILVAIIIIGLVYSGFELSKKYVASSFFVRSAIAASENNINMAIGYLENANDWDTNPQYLISLSDATIGQINNVAGDDDKNIEIKREEIKGLVNKAIFYADSAISADKTNYETWLALGRVYESLIPLQIEGAYDQAFLNYDEAAKYNPKDPAMVLTLARLELLNGDLAKAREKTVEAIYIKGNYGDAYMVLAEIENQEGNTNEVIASVEKAAEYLQTEPIIQYQAGVLSYQNNAHERARVYLERAVALNQSFADARYFLGLSYSSLGLTNEAISEFEWLKQSNPDNSEVESILSKLRAGLLPVR